MSTRYEESYGVTLAVLQERRADGDASDLTHGNRIEPAMPSINKNNELVYFMPGKAATNQNQGCLGFGIEQRVKTIIKRLVIRSYLAGILRGITVAKVFAWLHLQDV